MYLSMLNEKQKELFLGFAYHLVVSDGIYSPEEKALMNSYCYEMQIDLEPNKFIKPLDNILEEINIECRTKEKKIIIFEVIGLAMSDSSFDKEERELIHDAVIRFNLEADFDIKCEGAICEYIEFQNRLNEMILT
ncbi:hypothetical protein QTH19_07235 [Clostridium perfringens]|uniref:TerB family tellurite resistance protein n=1 Tax=Clostridium perfringens TaxID=1502 RepID=A0AAP4AA67_CLOPF|nr:hypothetical protein [Clostridium perfringens]MDH2336000.1 hypothetical protein [Clostridium perfringens]MDM0497018.1 hypothetical protein [Clostridium perfringens]